jgi:hypothetical protein
MREIPHHIVMIVAGLTSLVFQQCGNSTSSVQALKYRYDDFTVYQCGESAIAFYERDSTQSIASSDTSLVYFVSRGLLTPGMLDRARNLDFGLALDTIATENPQLFAGKVESQSIISSAKINRNRDLEKSTCYYLFPLSRGAGATEEGTRDFEIRCSPNAFFTGGFLRFTIIFTPDTTQSDSRVNKAPAVHVKVKFTGVEI